MKHSPNLFAKDLVNSSLFKRSSTAAVTLTCACFPLLTCGFASRAAGEAPRGIYTLGTGRDNPKTSQDERLSYIRDYDFVSGFTLRMHWNDFEPAEGQYNFAVIDEAIRRVSAIGQHLNLEVLLSDEPQYVLNGSSATYLDHNGGTNPVPWDAFAQQRQAALYQALGSHVVQGAGDPHVLSEDPTLLSVHAAPVGLNHGVRDLNNGIRGHVDYTQQRFIDAVVDGVAASTAAFPDDTNYLAFFGYSDNQPGVPADQQIINRLAPIYNGADQPELAFFVENLSDAGPLPTPNGRGTGSNLLQWANLGGDTMMQALDSWLKHPADRNAVLDSLTPAAGIELAYNAFGTRFFELYVTDIDGAISGSVDAAGRPLLDDLRYWHDVITGSAAPMQTADFDENSIVDAADLLLWSATFGAAIDPFHGDADGDNDVDGSDFLEWQRQTGFSAVATSVVPEPGALILAGGAACAHALSRRRRAPRR